MKTRLFNGTGVAVSEIGLGCWQLGGSDWGNLEERQALAILSSAYEAGVTFFDTADVYGAGRSEALIGKFVQGGDRKVFVATKLGRSQGLYPDHYTEANVRAARALGVSNWQIIWRHILPNSLTPVVTFLPFRMSGAILALTSLDFLGLGVPPGTPSLGELLSQGKNNIDAWWISLATFAVLVITLLLLTFMGDALRDALDPRKADR